MEYVTFNPWVGSKFNDPTNRKFKKRILVLGESHYCDGCDNCTKENQDDNCHDFTNQVVQEYIDGRRNNWATTFHKFDSALVGYSPSEEEAADIWNSIAFYNYINVAMPNRDVRPTSNQWSDSKNGFFEVLDTLEPDLIIAWGTSDMYYGLPGENWQAGEDLIIEGKNIKHGYYTNKKGKVIPIVFTYHPSYHFGEGFRPDFWHNVIEHFLQEV